MIAEEKTKLLNDDLPEVRQLCQEMEVILRYQQKGWLYVNSIVQWSMIEWDLSIEDTYMYSRTLILCPYYRGFLNPEIT